MIRPFKVNKITLEFTCTHGVYKGRQSVCYCTDKARADLVAAVLNEAVQSGRYDQILNEIAANTENLLK